MAKHWRMVMSPFPICVKDGQILADTVIQREVAALRTDQNHCAGKPL